MLPAEVSLVNEGLGLLRESYQDLAGKSAEIVAHAADFVRRNSVQGLLVTGGFVTLFNPGLEAAVARVVGIPVASAVSSVVAALRALSVQKLILVTPFKADMNAIIIKHLEELGYQVCAGPSFDKERRPGADVHVSSDELIGKVMECVEHNPAARAVYFQGATLDPLPVIQELESAAKVPVVTSNTAMVWNILNRLGVRLPIAGYGRLLATWPTPP